MESAEDVFLDFVGLRLELMDLEERFNPRGEKLEFKAPRAAKAWPGLWDEVEKLAREGLDKANGHRDYLVRSEEEPSRLRDDGDFWYDLFLLIGSASSDWASKPHPPALPLETLESILRSLLAVTEFTSSRESDIQQRNAQALRTFCAAFPGLGPSAEMWAERQPPGIARGMARAAAHASRQAGMPDVLLMLLE